MKSITIPAFLIIILSGTVCPGQVLSPHWEELTSDEFVKAIEMAKGVCIMEGNILEKDGPGGPMATDMLTSRPVLELATKQEYAILFPEFYVGQIVEAQHQPGTISYSVETQLMMLEETVSEMARNGCKKIILDAHGRDLVPVFLQSQLESPRDYVIYVKSEGGPREKTSPKAPPSGPDVDGHGGEKKHSIIMAFRPDLIKPELARTESNHPLRRLATFPPNLFTPIWWYADFPNHYSGDDTNASAKRGQVLVDSQVSGAIAAIRAVKADEETLWLQKEFYEKRGNPNASAR